MFTPMDVNKLLVLQKICINKWLCTANEYLGYSTRDGLNNKQ